MSRPAHISNDELAVAEERIRRLLAERNQLLREREHLSEVVDGLLSSKSWRLTQPMRSIAQGLRIVKNDWLPLYRKRITKVSAAVGRDIGEIEGAYRITGPGPYFELEAQDSRRFSGWANFELTIEGRQGHQFFYLHLPTGDVVTERERVLIPGATGEKSSVLIKFPVGYRGLRLEPFDSSESFRMTDLRVIEIGSVQMVLGILRRQWSAARRDPGLFLRKVKKAVAVFRESGLVGLRAKLFSQQFNPDYSDWVKRYDTLTDRDRDAIRSRVQTLPLKPLISVIMPVFNVEERWLRRAIDSVRGQLYPNWELCIADDASTAPHVREVLEEYQRADSRIRVVFRSENGHISAASNSALELAAGEFVALLDHDDELTEHALYLVVEEHNAFPKADFFYSDEDKLNVAGVRFNPYFKPDWNPILLRAQNYLCHLCVYRTAAVKAAGGFRPGFEGAQDWDLALRVTDRLSGDQIRHIPHVLYHWRVIEGSTAHSTASKPYVMEAQRRSVEEHLARSGVRGAEVEILEGISQLRVRMPLPEPRPLVSIIIPTKDQSRLLKRCVDSIIRKSTYGRFEIIIVDNNSSEPETFEYFRELAAEARVRILADRRPFNFAALNNAAVREANGELLAFLNNDLSVITPEWLEELVGFAVRPEVGAVGARLYYPNDLLQHGGVILGINGVAGHSHKGSRRGDPGYFNRIILPHVVSGVTAACAVMRRQVFEEIGGFDEEGLAVAFNDIDLCLKIREKGYLVVYNPNAELYHFESASRGYETTPEKFLRFEKEVATMKRRWGPVLQRDPYYNPNLSLLNEGFHFAFPPRVSYPWRNEGVT